MRFMRISSHTSSLSTQIRRGKADGRAKRPQCTSDLLSIDHLPLYCSGSSWQVSEFSPTCWDKWLHTRPDLSTAQLYGCCGSQRVSDYATTFILTERRRQSNPFFLWQLPIVRLFPRRKAQRYRHSRPPIPRSSPTAVDVLCRHDDNRRIPPTIRVSSPRSGTLLTPAASLGTTLACPVLSVVLYGM